MKNEYGAKLDRNGYAPSILDTEQGVCFRCTRGTDTARHEIFYGNGVRPKSKRYGLWADFCPYCHNLIHNNQKEDDELKRFMQRAAMDYYGWSLYDWHREFLDKSYL